MKFYVWFEERFGGAQGEDSPYSYQDVKEAWKAGRQSKEDKNEKV